ncbi:MAG: hypothetical protein IT509_02175 [Rhodocyclaceae bacterium]|nr:hypothetical protein [Rhodocyclaceae bacterium]
MPQLSSGRHVSLSASPFLDALSSEQDGSRYFAIVALRVHAATPQALRDHLVIGYFVDGQGTPPDAPSYSTGYCVADVLEGRTDWSPDEVDEFRQFLDQPRFRTWLQARFDEIDEAIRNNPVWGSELLVPGSSNFNVPTLKRAIIQNSAAGASAMAQLRGESLPSTAEMPSGPGDDHTMVAPQRVEHPRLPDELSELILTMARRPDVNSVSCQFTDPLLWEELLSEQVRRARQTGKHPRDAFFLCGPDGGIPGVAKLYPGLEHLPKEEWFTGDTLEERLGGHIHIPYEGVCGADLLVYPKWRAVYPEAWQKDGAELYSATAKINPCNQLLCNHLLIEQDLGEPACATRTGPIAGSWWLYSSRTPHKPCSPFHRDG